MNKAQRQALAQTISEESLPISCSKTCQCFNLSSKCTTHIGPCAIDISRRKNHTHVILEKNVGELQNEALVTTVKLCVSPKCIDPQEEASLQRFPERCCLVCYDDLLKIEQLDNRESGLLLYRWRINRPDHATGNCGY